MIEPNNGLELSADDMGAIDALMEPGLGATDLPEGERARRLVKLLGLLDAPVGEDAETLIDVTLARVIRDRERAAEPMLIPDDEEALDAWIGAGYRDTRVAPSLKDRARAHERLAQMATSVPAETGAEALVEVTLGRVQAMIDAQDERMRYETHRGRGRRLRMADVVSVAAVLLIGFSVVWPIFASVRQRGQVTACLGNFGNTSMAMGAYANANRDQLPLATASLGGGAWWDVDPKKPQSNSANLFTLTTAKFADLESLACPGNEHAPTAMWDEHARDWRSLEEISYSYQVMYGPERPSWTGSNRMIILTDRSPVIMRAYRREKIYPTANSTNHGGKGQHMLRTDGSASWATTPVTEDGDNIWLPRALEVLIKQVQNRDEIGLEGTETPASAQDVFVGP